MSIPGLALDRDAFLRDYWQRKPLLIRNSASHYSPPIDANTLAGLALEDEIESRIIEYVDQAWSVHQGPFTEQDFSRNNPWTLLVQAVDHYLPEVAQLKQWADFIPQWRVDDVMVSYAVDGGSVGPHYDHYDVFLLQGEGERLWQLGQFCDESTPVLAHEQIRVLSQFQMTQEYLLKPGDVLYVPPGLAHWGIAQGECTTFSIGFRAPRASDLLSRYVDSTLETGNPDEFFTDAGRARVRRPGEIEAADIENARQSALKALAGNSETRWFGELVTEPRYEPGLPLEQVQAIALLDGAAQLDVSNAAKLAWQVQQDGIVVFSNGNSALHDGDVLPILIKLCDKKRIAGHELEQAREQIDSRDLLIELLCAGVLLGDDDYNHD